MDDPEIVAMSAVVTALAGLEDEARGRVLRWASERYDVALVSGLTRPVSNGNDARRIDDSDDEVHADEIAADASPFEHFAEQFAKAQPATDSDKVLVAAYWLQAIKGDDKWQAAAVQKELKNLGHAVANVTVALTSNMRKKPQRILQLKKAGNAQQARKTYKVTHEGIVYVQGMLSASGG
jgi:hypothetical protein